MEHKRGYPAVSVDKTRFGIISGGWPQCLLKNF